MEQVLASGGPQRDRGEKKCWEEDERLGVSV
jgi:hypothetical protein